MLLQRHGLGQALVCLEMRGDGKPTSPYSMLARQLDRWLLFSMAVRRSVGADGAVHSR